MSAAAWAELLRATDGLRRTGMVKGILPAGELPDYHADLAVALGGFARAGKPHAGLKIFVERVLAPGMNEALLHDPPAPEETLQVWGERFFAGKTFGLIQNYLETYTNSIPERLARLVAPLVERHGLPPGGFSSLYFLGNYGFTPFGVHRGSPGEDGILLHLGPGRKTFYIWDTDEYDSLTNHAPSYHDIDSLLAYAVSFELEPGDAISFPWDVYHIAYTHGYSASIVLDFNRPDPGRMLRILYERIPPAGVDDTNFLPPVDAADFSPEPDPVFAAGLLQRFNAARAGLYHQLKSNGGFYRPSLYARTRIGKGSRIRLRTPFRIQIAGPEGRVYSRGHHWTPDRSLETRALIGRLNAGETIPYERFLEILGPPETLQAAYAFLAQLAQTDILDVTGED